MTRAPIDESEDALPTRGSGEATPARIAADERAARARPAPHALARWSERRRRVAEAEGAPDAMPDGAVPEAPPSEALAANRAAAEAVDVEALGPGADVSALLREGVPDALRRTALRALWRSDPVFANVDRLCDYDDDFRDPKMVVETLQSAWQAGRGYLFADDEAAEDEPEGGDGPSGEAAQAGPAATEAVGAPANVIAGDGAGRSDAPTVSAPVAVRPPDDVASPEIMHDGPVDAQRADAREADPTHRDREPRPPSASLRGRLGL